MFNRGFIIAVVCIGAMVAILYGRLWIYHHPENPVQVGQTASEPLSVQGAPIIVHYHERRPYYFEEGQDRLRGLCVDPVNLIFAKSGIAMEWRKTPAKQQLEHIKENTERECAAGWFKTDARQKFGLYTLPIYQDGSTIALARADNELMVSGRALKFIMKNRRLRMISKDGYAYGEFIDGHIARYYPRQVITGAGNLSMLKMVYTHRGDYFFLTVQEAEDLIHQSGLPSEKFKLVRFQDMPGGNKRYLICSQKVGNSVITKLNQAIKRHLPPNESLTGK